MADSIYWMSRHIERAENVARFVDVNLHFLLDLRLVAADQWMPLISTSGDNAKFMERYGEASKDNVLQFLTFDEENPNSILSCLRKARANARTVRDIISSEMWEQVNRFYLMIRAATASRKVADLPNDLFTEVKMASHLFSGITDTTMSHSEAWHFARLGRLFERADKTARILDVKYFMLLPRVEYVGTPYDAILWASLLKSASAFEMYRKRHQSIEPDRVAEFLILDRYFPRSINYCLIHAEESMQAITGSSPGYFSNPAERRLGRLRSELGYAQIDEIIATGMHEYLDGIEDKLNQIGEAVYETFFAVRS